MMTTWPDMKMGGKPLGPPISSSNCFTGRYSPTYRVPEQHMRRGVPNTSMDIFNVSNDILAREGLVAIDMSDMKHTPPGTPLPHHALRESRESMVGTPGPITYIKQDMMYPSGMGSPAPPNTRQMESHEMSLDMLGTAVASSGMSVPISMSDCVSSPHHLHHSMSMYQTHTGMMGGPHNPLTHHPHHPHGAPMPLTDADTDPRELEAFAERFKQRRIKLGVTQCDVGKALANLKLPGVGALSQSTISGSSPLLSPTTT